MRTAARPTKCPSCGSERARRYCAECGERLLSSDDLNLRHFLFEQLPHECLHVDGKLPRTLRLLFSKPGALAVNYVAGRRQRFVGPLRFYLLLFLLHLFMAAALGGVGAALPERVRDFDAFGILSHLMHSRPNVNWQGPMVVSHVREYGRWLSEAATLLIFMVVAIVQKWLFWRQHRRYLEHVALALNVASFFMAVFVIGELLFAAVSPHRFGESDALLQSLLGMSALPIYWFLAIRRFYGLKTLPAAAAAVVVTAAHAVVAVGLNTIVYAILISTA
jgi:hypothetical protein